MPAPDERDRFGALPHDPDCHACPHAHHVLPCDWCLCSSDFAPGIDTALGGTP